MSAGFRGLRGLAGGGVLDAAPVAADAAVFYLDCYDAAGVYVDSPLQIGPTVADAITLARKLIGSASTTSRATFNAPHGSAPTSPVNGDIWTTTAGIYVRINGSTVGPLSTGGGGASEVWFSPADMHAEAIGLYTACLSQALVAGTIIYGMGCEDGVNDCMIMSRGMPADYDLGDITVTVYWITTSSDTDDTLWGCLFGTADIGEDVSTATGTYLADPDTSHVISTNAGALIVNSVSFTPTTPPAPAAGVPLIVFVGRVANPGLGGTNDTLAATAYVIGVKIAYN